MNLAGYWTVDYHGEKLNDRKQSIVGLLHLWVDEYHRA
jgi:hypothetical protein